MIIVDTEGTGTDPNQHALIEIGAIDFFKPENRFEIACRVWEGAQFEFEALRINGHSPEDLADPKKPTQAEALSAFDSWARNISERTIAGQNPQFDASFLKVAYARCGLPWIFGKRFVDQHAIAYTHALRRGVLPPSIENVSNVNSDFIMEYVGIPAEPKPHKAIRGAMWEAEALSRLLYGKSLLTEFSQYPVPEYLSQQ